MLFAKKYETFDEMNKLYNMHFEAKETKMYLRTRMIMLSWDGYTVPEIGRILDIHPHTVRHWIKQYNERGINGLYDAEKPVPQPLYSEELENEIADLVFTPPKQLGLPFGRWTCERMAQYLVDTGKVKHISGEKVRQILHKKRVSFKKAKLHITSPDDQYEVKKRIEELKANYPANSVILYEDECGPLNSKTQLTKSWSPVGKPQKVEGNTPNVGSINLFGAYDYRTGEVFYKFTKKKNSYEFKRFLKRLLFRFKGRKIYLILDNARYHTSREMQAWLAKQEGKIEFVFLPKQSPWLNPIEPVWEDFKNDRIRNRHFTSMRQIISESRGYFKQRRQRAVQMVAA